jgi:hypothetical protein
MLGEPLWQALEDGDDPMDDQKLKAPGDVR